MHGKGRKRKKIYIYLSRGKFRVYPDYGTRIVDREKKGIKNEEISISAPCSTNVKSNFRHWNSKEGFSISRSFFFSPPIFFFHAKLLFRSSWSFFLIVTLHRFARRFGSTGIFILRRYEWLARDCLAFSYTWEIRKVCNYWFSSFFSPFLLSFFPVPPTYRCIFFSRFFLFPLFPSFFPYPTLFAFCTLFSRTHVRSTVCTLWKEIVGLKLTVHRASTSARTCLFPSTCLRISDVLLGAIDFLFFLQREVINCRVFGFLSSFFCFSSLYLVEAK